MTKILNVDLNYTTRYEDAETNRGRKITLTKNEIFDKLMTYLDFGIAVGFYTDEEADAIETLERMYFKAEK